MLDKKCIFSWLYVSESMLFNKLSVSYSGVRIALIWAGQSMAININFYVCVRRNLCMFFSVFVQTYVWKMGFPGGSEVKASACNAGDLGSIPGLGRSPGEGNGNPLQYSCLENPTDGGAWWAIVHGVAKSRTRLSDFTSLHYMPKCWDW